MQTYLLKPGLITHPLVDDELALDFKGFSEHRALKVPAFHFRMVRTDTRQEAGYINLRLISSDLLLRYVGHIGYGVDELHRGRHFAARSLRLLLPFARVLALEAIWITCNPDNLASRRTCELAGAELVDIIDVPLNTETFRAGAKQKCRYLLRLSAGESPSAGSRALLVVGQGVNPADEEALR